MFNYLTQLSVVHLVAPFFVVSSIINDINTMFNYLTQLSVVKH